MNDFAEGFATLVIGLLLVCAMAVFGGTIVWLVWEDSITAMFPKAVETGVLAATLTWWQSVKISWIFALLIKSSTTTNNTKK